MKKSIIALFLAAFTTGLASQALADCQIFNDICPNNLAYGGRVFADSDAIAPYDANRCLQRARDWRTYCGNLNSASYFSTAGVYKIAVTVNISASQLWVPDFSNQWRVIQSNY